MATIEPLLIKFNPIQRQITRGIKNLHGIAEATFIKAAIEYIARNPHLLSKVLRQIEKNEEQK